MQLPDAKLAGKTSPDVQGRRDFDIRTNSNMGSRHRENQDFVLAEPLAGVFAIADGSGGHFGGAEASEVACEVMLGAVLESTVPTRFRRSEARATFQLGLKRIVAEMRNWAKLASEMSAMSTTLTFGWIVQNRLHLFHLGDSRAYLYRDGVLTRLTVDHTYVQRLYERGEIREHELRSSTLKHLVTRCINVEGQSLPDMHSVCLRPNDQLLLFTDGITDWIEDHVIEDACRFAESSNELCEWLSQCALHAGSSDDRSCVVAACNTTPLLALASTTAAESIRTRS